MAPLHAKNACVLAVFLLLAAPFGGRALLSVGLGGVISILNLRLLERSVARLLGMANETGALLLRLFLHLRLGFLFAVVAVALWSERVEPIAFTIGLSSAVPAVLWHGLRSGET